MNQQETFLKKLDVIKKYSGSFSESDKNNLEHLENEFYMAVHSYEFDVAIAKYNLLDKLNIYSKKLSDNQKSEYNRYNISVTHKRNIVCPTCNLSLLTYDLSLCCDICGYNEPINSTLFDDFKNKKCNKKKDYSSYGFCEKWLDLIQGKTITDIPEELEQKLMLEITRKCSIRGQIIPKLLKQLTCMDIRNWLRTYKFTKYNKYASFIIRFLTKKLKYEVLPPQFTIEEEHLILNDFKYLSPIYCDEYNKLKQKNNKKNNNSYYPLFIYFISKQRWPYRANDLDQFIYKQSLNTFNLRLICWEHTLNLTNYQFL